jgi:hypothetical protein
VHYVAPALLVLVIDIRKRLAVRVSDDEAFGAFIDGLRGRKATRSGHHFSPVELLGMEGAILAMIDALEA